MQVRYQAALRPDLKSNRRTLTHGRLAAQASRTAEYASQIKRYAAKSSPNNTLSSTTYSIEFTKRAPRTSCRFFRSLSATIFGGCAQRTNQRFDCRLLQEDQLLMRALTGHCRVAAEIYKERGDVAD